MPPAISDDEVSEGAVEVPIRSAKKGAREKKAVNYIELKPDDLDDGDDDDDVEEVAAPKPTEKVNDGDAGKDEDEDEDDEEEDEYIVEKILSHMITDDGIPVFEVKWEGYEKKSDRTWEPEENLQGNASEALEEYFAGIGGREKLFEDTRKALATKKRGRQSTGAMSSGTTKRARRNGDHPSDSTPPASAAATQWKPPAGSWDEHIESLDACEDEKTHTLIVYLTWKNGQKTQHPLQVIYKRAPQKMLQFYERHVRIIKKDDSPAK